MATLSHPGAGISPTPSLTFPLFVTYACPKMRAQFNVKPAMNQVPRIKTVARDMEYVPVRQARHLGRPQYQRLRQKKNEQLPR